MDIVDDIDWGAAEAFLTSIAARAIADAANYMAGRMRAYCPIDTGFLQSSISVSESPSGLTYVVVAAAFYAQYVEFGHTTRAGTFVAPNPFMRKALEDTAAHFPEIAGKAAVNVPFGNSVRSYAGMPASDNGIFLGSTFTTD